MDSRRVSYVAFRMTTGENAPHLVTGRHITEKATQDMFGEAKVSGGNVSRVLPERHPDYP